MAISFVSAGATFTRTSSGTGFTINKPSGLAAGDLMLALVAFAGSATELSVTNPSGWTTVRVGYRDDGNDSVQFVVLSRQATSSEPSSWAGSISSSNTRMLAGAVAYRGVQSILATGTSGSTLASSYSTVALNNTVSGARRVVMAAYVSSTDNYNLSSNETSNRFLAVTGSDSPGAQAACWDSNGAVAVGSTSRTVSRSQVWSVSIACILLLEPAPLVSASGTFSLSLSSPTASAAATANDPATVAVSLGPVTQAFTGAGAPVAGSGTVGVQLSPVSMSAAGLLPVSGTMSAMVLPAIGFVGETRVFGVRVIVVDADNRTIAVPSRGVED